MILGFYHEDIWMAECQNILLRKIGSQKEMQNQLEMVVC